MVWQCQQARSRLLVDWPPGRLAESRTPNLAWWPGFVGMCTLSREWRFTHGLNFRCGGVVCAGLISLPRGVKHHAPG